MVESGRAQVQPAPSGREQGKLIIFRPDAGPEERFVVPEEGDYDLELLGKEAEETVRAFKLKKALQIVAGIILATVGLFHE